MDAVKAVAPDADGGDPGIGLRIFGFPIPADGGRALRGGEAVAGVQEPGQDDLEGGDGLGAVAASVGDDFGCAEYSRVTGCMQ
jgi:hypothetical protein